jgi:hypothetical protein
MALTPDERKDADSRIGDAAESIVRAETTKS